MAVLIARRSHDPATCTVCGRQAAAIGHHDRRWKQEGVLWSCRSPKCLSIIAKVANMPAEQLKAYEGAALIAAARRVALPLLTDCMTALYEAGARNLDEATPEQFDAAAHAMMDGGAASALVIHLSAALAAFGNHLHSELQTDPPF